MEPYPFDKLNPGFLLPVEHKLLHHFITAHQDAFAWKTTERGHFKEEYFPPIKIPVVPHTPWVHNIPIPPGLHAEVCQLIPAHLVTFSYLPFAFYLAFLKGHMIY